MGRNRVCGVLVGLALVHGCAEAKDLASDDAGVDAGGASEPALTAACAGETLEPGDHTIGPPRSRQYIVHVPPHEPGTALPVVLNMHGFLMSADLQQMVARMDAAADERGYVVIYPSGLDTLRAFNAGDCCAFNDMARDDVGYLIGLVDEVGESLCLDLDRVYASGFSNGGFMAYRLACERPDRFAAIASVAGVLGIEPGTCNPDYVLPALHLHGTADLIVPYQGGEPAGFSVFFSGSTPPTFRSVDETVTFYRMLAGCDASGEVVFDQADTLCTRHADCDPGSEHTLCTIRGAGHSWPGGDAVALDAAFQPLSFALGTTSTTLDASAMLLDFFGEHRRRADP